MRLFFFKHEDIWFFKERVTDSVNGKSTIAESLYIPTMPGYFMATGLNNNIIQQAKLFLRTYKKTKLIPDNTKTNTKTPVKTKTSGLELKYRFIVEMFELINEFKLSVIHFIESTKTGNTRGKSLNKRHFNSSLYDSTVHIDLEEDILGIGNTIKDRLLEYSKQPPYLGYGLDEFLLKYNYVYDDIPEDEDALECVDVIKEKQIRYLRQTLVTKLDSVENVNKLIEDLDAGKNVNTNVYIEFAEYKDDDKK